MLQQISGMHGFLSSQYITPDQACYKSAECMASCPVSPFVQTKPATSQQNAWLPVQSICPGHDPHSQSLMDCCHYLISHLNAPILH